MIKYFFIFPQTATSLKSFIDSWNIQTALWLKRCVLFLCILCNLPIAFFCQVGFFLILF